MKVMIPRSGQMPDGDGKRKFMRWTSVIEFPHDHAGSMADALHAMHVLSKELHMPVAPLIMAAAANVKKEDTDGS